jgi:hypothetical protein
MATQAQINANRQNAQKSTGPKTDEGKAAVSQNAVKHGLFAVQDVLSVENQAEFDLMREQLLAELAPIGVVESLLAQRAVSLAWRLKRAERMQNETIERLIEYRVTRTPASQLAQLYRQGDKTPQNYLKEAKDNLTIGRAALYDWSNEKTLERMFLNERRIENSLYRTIAKLRAVQLMRQMAQADAAEAEQSAQANTKDNSEKQSQSRLSPKEISDFIERTYGDNPPLWAQATLRRLNSSPDADFKSLGRPKPIPARQTHGNGKKRGVPLGLLRL